MVKAKRRLYDAKKKPWIWKWRISCCQFGCIKHNHLKELVHADLSATRKE